MKLKRLWLMAGAAVLAAGMGAGVRGQSVLDDALGDGKKDAKPAAGAKVEADQKPGRPKVPDIVSPDAAKQLDDQDLLNKLTGKADTGGGGGYDPTVKMNEIMERMDQIQTRLAKDKDPGLLTQETENRVVIDIDAMIEILKKAQQQQSSSKADPNSKPSEEKQETKTEKTEGPQEQQGNQSATKSQLPGGTSATPGSNMQDMHDWRLGWGDLPAKDREAVANGAKEKFLPEYKEMIERYYEALAELGKSAKDR